MLCVDNIVHIFRNSHLDIYDLYNFLLINKEYYNYLQDIEIKRLIPLCAKRYLIREYGYIFMMTNKVKCESIVSQYESMCDFRYDYTKDMFISLYEDVTSGNIKDIERLKELHLYNITQFMELDHFQIIKDMKKYNVIPFLDYNWNIHNMVDFTSSLEESKKYDSFRFMMIIYISMRQNNYIDGTDDMMMDMLDKYENYICDKYDKVKYDTADISTENLIQLLKILASYTSIYNGEKYYYKYISFGEHYTKLINILFSTYRSQYGINMISITFRGPLEIYESTIDTIYDHVRKGEDDCIKEFICIFINVFAEETPIELMKERKQYFIDRLYEFIYIDKDKYISAINIMKELFDFYSDNINNTGKIIYAHLHKLMLLTDYNPKKISYIKFICDNFSSTFNNNIVTNLCSYEYKLDNKRDKNIIGKTIILGSSVSLYGNNILNRYDYKKMSTRYIGIEALFHFYEREIKTIHPNIIAKHNIEHYIHSIRSALMES